MIALAGMDPIAFLEEKDGFRRILMQSIAKRLFELIEKRDIYRANLNANEIIRRIKL